MSSCRSSRHQTRVSMKTKINLGHRKGNEKNVDKELQKAEKRANQEVIETDVEPAAVEEEIVEGWNENKPNISFGSPKSWDPEFTKKAVPRAVDCFALYFDDEVIDMILEHTNRAGAEKYTTQWAVLTADELRAYFGLLLLMSVSPRHHFYHYWSRDSLFNSEEIAKVMSFKRFQYIMNSLRVNDHSKEKKKGEDGYDRLAKLRPLINKLNRSFQEEYLPSSYQAIDESMIAFKGRSSMKKYLPMKPIKRGYKVWCRADSKSGYLLQFEVYEGKNASRPANQSLGEHVVLSLSENVKPGTQLFFDNYFTCTKLMETLAERSILAAGTVRTNRKDLPVELKQNNKLKKGEYIWRTKGQVTAYQWHDTKDVHLLSNFHDPTETVEVPRKLTNGSSVAVTCPKAVADYNLWMGAVDRFDQKRNAYTSDRRSKKSWYRIFYFLFDAAVVNAFIQHNANNDISYMWFRLENPELQVSARRLPPKEQEPLFQRLFHVKVRSVAGSRGSAAGKHRPSSCASLMARSFRFHGRLCLLCGCFFIRNLFGRPDQQRTPKVVWKSWYTLYSSGCIVFLCWTVVDDIVYNGYRAARSRHALDSSLRAVANAVALVKIIANLMCLLRGSSRIIDFYVRSAAFERRVGMPSCECCAPRRYFWSDVRRACLCIVYCAAFGVTAFLSPQAIESTIGRGNDNGWIDACFWISFMVTSVFYFAYDNVHTVALRSSCEVLVEYVKVQLRVLEECLALGANEQTLSPGRDDDVPARLESVRLNLCEIQRLKNAINDVWNWSLVVNGAFVLLLLCTAVYDLCTDGLGGRENYGSWFYAAYTTYEFVSLTFLSQSLSNMGKKIQDACKMTRSVDNDRYRHQMQCLRDSVDSEDLSLRAGDFFKLKVSLLVSVGVYNLW
ncbi:hypothetical protein MTO96_045582 [Rhipicephalus appendiculatus]